MIKKYLTIMDQELEKIETFAMRNPLHFQNDPAHVNAIIFLALENPDWNVAQILDWYQNKKGVRIKLNVRHFLDRNHMLKPSGRKECFEAIDREYNNFYNLMNAQEDIARSSFAEMRNQRRSSPKNWPVVARVILIKLSDDMKGSRDPEEQRIGERVSSVISKSLLPPTAKLFNNMLDRIAQARGFSDAGSVDDQLFGLIQEVEQLEDVEPGTPSMDIEAIREENADLRSTLFGLKQELTDLQKNIHDLQASTKNQAIISFLTEMNAPSSGYLLDNVAKSSQVISELLRNGWTPESPDLEGVVYSLKMILDFLNRIGLAPIRTLGDQAKITMEDLSYVNYSGSEFHDSKQIKQVEFRTTGWSYKGQLISRPQAIELRNNSELEGE